MINPHEDREVTLDDRPPVERRVTPGNVLAAVFGAALFAYTIHRTGLAPIAEGIRSVGWGFAVIVALSGLRILARSAAWALCSEGVTPLRIRDTFPAIVTGDALGNLTPLGLFVSEPTKAALVRHRVPLMTAISGLAIENLIYSVTVAVVIAGGIIALLVRFELPRPLRLAMLAVVAVVVVLLVACAWVISRRVGIVTGLIGGLHKRRLAPRALVSRLEKLRELELGIANFHRHHPDRLFPVLLLETAYHAAGVAEVFVTLLWLVGTPSLLVAFIFETANRAINVIFKFVPLRLGVDEAGTGLLANALGYTSATGVTLAIVRKVRVLFWSAIGVLLLVRRGLTPAPAGLTRRVGG